MPTYQYACTDCGHRFEQVQAFSDASLTVCPQCGGKLRKVYGSVGVVFKGSGFYRTDARAGNIAADAPAKKPDTGDSGSSAGAAASTPAATTGGSATSSSTASSSPAASSSSSSSSSSAGKGATAAAG